MIELKSTQFSTAKLLFDRACFGALAAGTLEGGHPGRVFVDDLSHPRVGMVCTTVGYYLLAGDPGAAGVLPGLCDLFCSDLGPAQMEGMNDPQIILFFNPPEWKAPLFDAFAEQKPRYIRKEKLVFPKGNALSSSQKWREEIPEGMHLEPVSLELLEQHPEKEEEISVFWGSPERFVKKGLGFWLMEEGNIASSCEAVFVGAGEAELSIATSMEYRRRGLASLVAYAFIEACQERDLRPIWGCWPENLPSMALAERLGFVEDCKQDICFFECQGLG